MVEEPLGDAGRERDLVDRNGIVGPLAEEIEPEREELRAPLVHVQPRPGRLRCATFQRGHRGTLLGCGHRGTIAGY